MEQRAVSLLLVLRSTNLKQNTLKSQQLHYVWEKFFWKRLFSKIFWEKDMIYLYDFSVDYDAIAIDDILGIHKHLMKNHDI